VEETRRGGEEETGAGNFQWRINELNPKIENPKRGMCAHTAFLRQHAILLGVLRFWMRK
jgi:hypothetical protein